MAYVENGGNGTRAALQVYGTEDENTAAAPSGTGFLGSRIPVALIPPNPLISTANTYSCGRGQFDDRDNA